MSALAVAAAPQPTRYLIGVPFPPDARIDLAFTVTLELTSTTNTVSYVVPGEYFDLPLAIVGDYTTDNTIGNRNMNFQAYDPDGTLKWLVHAPAAQAPSSTFTYSLSEAFTTTFTTAQTMQMPLPSVVLGAGMTLTGMAAGAAAGDSWRSLSVTVTRVPSGPPIQQDTATPAATPILV